MPYDELVIYTGKSVFASTKTGRCCIVVDENATLENFGMEGDAHEQPPQA